MGDIKKFVEHMVWWCDHGNLGYDQSQRWNIVFGGETDCSALVIHCAKAAGFDVGSSTYTGNMRSNFSARGWAVLSPSVAKQAGDILLNDANHVAVYIGNGRLAQASIDERGRITGGASGDQTGYETNTRAYYEYPWSCVLRWNGAGASGGSDDTSSRYNPNGYGWEYTTVIQRLLQAAGSKYESMLQPDGADGVLGPNTFRAVQAFQVDKGLTADGIPGPHTLQALRAASQPLSRVTVDGDWGPETAARFREVMGVDRSAAWPTACKSFQRFLNAVVAAPHIINLTGHSQLAVDGVDGHRTWTVFQWWVNNAYPGTCARIGGVVIDGVPGPQTYKAVQALLNASTAGSGRLGK